MSQTTSPALTVFGIVARPRPYLSLLYLLLAFPLGLAYFVYFLVGLSLGVGLTIVWIGLPILLLMVLSAYGLSGLERQLAIHLLGEEVPPLRRRTEQGEGFWRWLKAVVTTSTTWKGLFFLLVKFPLGLACWILTIVLLSTSLAFILAPVIVLMGEPIWIFNWRVDTLPEALFWSLLGLVLGLVSLHVFNALGFLWGKMSKFLLGQPAAALSGAIAGELLGPPAEEAPAEIPPEPEAADERPEE